MSDTTERWRLVQCPDCDTVWRPSWRPGRCHCRSNPTMFKVVRDDAYQALAEEANRLREALAALADIHHRTLVNSRKHDPENREWQDCDCRTCSLARMTLARGPEEDTT